MSDDALNSARLHLSEAADLAKTMADGFAMKKLTRALNRCNPISVNPHSPQGYAENWFEGNNVGAPPQSPQYSVGSYPEGRPVESNFVDPPDPCAGMREQLAACGNPQMYTEHAPAGTPEGGQFISSGGGSNSGSSDHAPDQRKAAASIDKQIEEIGRKIMEVVNDGKGNSAKVVKQRMKIIGPLVKEQDRLKMMRDPDSPMAIAASSSLKPAEGGFEVSHGGDMIGRLVKEKYSGFKTVNGAPQLTQKEGWVVIDPEGNRLASRIEKRADAVDMLADRHSKKKKAGSQGSDQSTQNSRYAVFSRSDTIPPALPDPCQGMRDTLRACSPYCPSFMGQPTGEVPPLAGQPQPLDTYASFTDQLGPVGDPHRSLNDTLRQLWLRNAVQQSSQMPYAQGHKPKGPGGGQFTSGVGGSGESSTEGRDWDEANGPQIKDDIPQIPPTVAPGYVPDGEQPAVPPWKRQPILPQGVINLGGAGFAVQNEDGRYISAYGGWTTREENAQIFNSPQEAAAAKNRMSDYSAYSYPQNPDGRAQGPMTAIPEGDFLGGRFGPGIKRMREQLRACRSC